jgi:hypothetical protein
MYRYIPSTICVTFVQAVVVFSYCREAHAAPTVTVEATIKVAPITTRICALDLTNGGQTLVLTDGYCLSDGKPDIYFYSAADLEPLGTMIIQSDLPWSFGSLVLFSDKRRMLVCDRAIDLESQKTRSRLDVNSAVERGNVRPMPLAVSPSSNICVVHIGSYLSNDLDVLGVFDMKSGKLLRRLAKGKRIRDVNARFLNESTLLVRYQNGEVELHDLVNQAANVLESHAPETAHIPDFGKNLDLIPLSKRNHIAFAGRDRVSVIDIKADKEIFTDVAIGANVVVTDDGRLLYQVVSPRESPSTTSLRIRNTKDWQLNADIPLPQQYDLLLNATDGDRIFAVDFDTIFLLRIHWDTTRSVTQRCTEPDMGSRPTMRIRKARCAGRLRFYFKRAARYNITW